MKLRLTILSIEDAAAMGHRYVVVSQRNGGPLEMILSCRMAARAEEYVAAALGVHVAELADAEFEEEDMPF
jgi:hypothetical protein